MTALRQSFLEGLRLLQRFSEDENAIERVQAAADVIAESIRQGGKPIICGNGGSMCDAMHFEEEFTGRYRSDRKALPALSLSNPGHLSCVANDYGYDEVFRRGVEAHGKKGDVFIGLSTSGNSENVIRAHKQAQSQGLHTLLLLGKSGGKLKGHADYEWIIPGDTADRIQEVHMMILHVLIEGVERALFPELY